MADDEVLVKIEDEPQKTEEKPDAAVAELQAQYEDLKKKDAERDAELQATRRREQEARDAANAARQETTQVKTEIADTQLNSVTAGISAAESEAESATAEYAAAMEKGDYAAAAQAQRKMARAESQLGRLTEAKSDLEARKAYTPPPQEQRRQAKDPVEAYIDHPDRGEPTKNWLRSHKEWITDPRKNAKLTAAHYDAIGDGISIDSPEYFEFVEKKIGLKTDPKPTAQPARKSAPPVAPVNGGGGSGSGDNEVRLSQREAAAATDGTHTWNYEDPSGQKRWKKGDPIGIQEFARRKREMTKQGLYDKSKLE